MRDVVVDEFPTNLEAEEAAALLLQEGCVAEVRERASSGLDQYLHAAGRWYELRVKEGDLEKARTVVATFRADLEKDAAESEAAAREEASPEQPAAAADDAPRATTLSDGAKQAGLFLQAYALVMVVLAALISWRQPHTVFPLGPVIAALFDFGLGHWIRQGGRNAGRLATVRLWLTAAVWSFGVLFADPETSRLPLALDALSVVVFASSISLILWSDTKRGLGKILFAVWLLTQAVAVWAVASPAGARQMAGAPVTKLTCPSSEGWHKAGTWSRVGGNEQFSFCTDGSAVYTGADGVSESMCWSSSGTPEDGYFLAFEPGHKDQGHLSRLVKTSDTALLIDGYEYAPSQWPSRCPP